MLFFYVNKLYTMSKYNKKISVPGCSVKIFHLDNTCGKLLGNPNINGKKIPELIVNVKSPNSTIGPKSKTKYGKYHRKKDTMRKSKKSRKQTKKKGKKHRKSSKKSRKTRK